MDHDDHKQKKTVLLSACGRKADDTHGICDQQWCRFTAKALTDEILATVGKFAKLPVKLTVVMMSL